MTILLKENSHTVSYDRESFVTSLLVFIYFVLEKIENKISICMVEKKIAPTPL